MPLNDGVSEVKLPRRKRDVVNEIRGQTRKNATRVPEGLTAYNGSDSPTRRLRAGQVSTVEISVREYELLCKIAALAENFLPTLDNAGMRVQQAKAFAMLAECTTRFRGMKRVSSAYADTHAMLGMIAAARKLQR